MKFINLLLVLSLLGFSVSCSMSKKLTDDSAVSDVADAGEDSAEDADFIVDEEDENLLAEDEKESANETEEVAKADEPTEVAQATEEMERAKPEVNMNLREYTVEKGDTLMFVAFKLFGDYRKWRSLSRMNNIANGSSLAAGDKLKYEGADFSWEPQGEPYLIKWGDTLSRISTAKYGTWKRWKEIHENNKPMIQDPNLIFAGFTLYYITDRDLASE